MGVQFTVLVVLALLTSVELSFTGVANTLGVQCVVLVAMTMCCFECHVLVCARADADATVRVFVSSFL